jgi:hypothetical protein
MVPLFYAEQLILQNFSYYDESGFALDPTIPYAWQEPNSVIELPARKAGRINVLGFMNRHNDLHPFMFEQQFPEARKS